MHEAVNELRFAAAGPAPFFEVPYSLGFTNLFLRSSFGVMAPDLARELALEPAALSMVASAFFFAYAAMQVPTGMLLDRFGPRRTVATLLLFTAAGTALFATGQSATTLTVARLLMGIGCAGVFTGAFYVLTQWLQTDKVVSQVGALNSFAALGNALRHHSVRAAHRLDRLARELLDLRGRCHRR